MIAHAEQSCGLAAQCHDPTDTATGRALARTAVSIDSIINVCGIEHALDLLGAWLELHDNYMRELRCAGVTQ